MITGNGTSAAPFQLVPGVSRKELARALLAADVMQRFEVIEEVALLARLLEEDGFRQPQPPTAGAPSTSPPPSATGEDGGVACQDPLVDLIGRMRADSMLRPATTDRQLFDFLEARGLARPRPAPCTPGWAPGARLKRVLQALYNGEFLDQEYVHARAEAEWPCDRPDCRKPFYANGWYADTVGELAAGGWYQSHPWPRAEVQAEISRLTAYSAVREPAIRQGTNDSDVEDLLSFYELEARPGDTQEHASRIALLYFGFDPDWVERALRVTGLAEHRSDEGPDGRPPDGRPPEICFANEERGVLCADDVASVLTALTGVLAPGTSAERALDQLAELALVYEENFQFRLGVTMDLVLETLELQDAREEILAQIAAHREAGSWSDCLVDGTDELVLCPQRAGETIGILIPYLDSPLWWDVVGRLQEHDLLRDRQPFSFPPGLEIESLLAAAVPEPTRETLLAALTEPGGPDGPEVCLVADPEHRPGSVDETVDLLQAHLGAETAEEELLAALFEQGLLVETDARPRFSPGAQLEHLLAALDGPGLLNEESVSAAGDPGQVYELDWHRVRTGSTFPGDWCGSRTAEQRAGHPDCRSGSAEAWRELGRALRDPSRWDPLRLSLPFTWMTVRLALGWVLLFPVLLVVARRVYGLRRRRLAGTVLADAARGGDSPNPLRALRTSDESMVWRDWWEQSFGWLLLLVLGVGLIELLPYAVHHFHYLDLGGRSVGSLAVAALSLLVTALAGPALAFMQRFGRTIALVLVGIAGPLLLLIVFAYTMEHVVYAPSGGVIDTLLGSLGGSELWELEGGRRHLRWGAALLLFAVTAAAAFVL